MRANEITDKTAKPAKVTAVVTVTSIFFERNAICGALILDMRSLLAIRRKVLSFWRKILTNQETSLTKLKKVGHKGCLQRC
jgi:hypothetical protein